MPATIKKLAVKTLVLPDGKRLHQQVLVFDGNENLVSYHDLDGEEAFCEWYRGEWRL